MTQRNLFWPLSIIIIFCLFLLGPFIFNSSTAAPLSQSCGSPGNAAYDACVKATAEACATAGSTGYTACKATQTAEQRQSDIASGTTFATNTSTNTSTSAPTSPPAAQQNSPTTTNTATRSVTSTVAAGTTLTPVRGTPTLSPTLGITTETLVTPTAEVKGVLCPPGSSFILTGEGPPATALIITFDPQVSERTPTPSAGRAVAGALTDSAGRYRVTLLIGDERPGIYDVRVRIRSSREVLDTQVCTVPIATPTETPRAGR